MTHEEALQLVRTYIKNENMVKHCLAAEAVMAALAERLGQDREKWALAGLLHDLDVEVTNADLKAHGLETVRMLQELGVDPEIVDAIRMHNEEAHGDKRSAVFHHALAAGETITGLIIATALVLPGQEAGQRQGHLCRQADEGEGVRAVGEPRHDPRVREDRHSACRVCRDRSQGHAGDQR